MGYRLLETSTHKTWINDTTFQENPVTVWLEQNLSTVKTEVDEGTKIGGDEISEQDFLDVVNAAVGENSELGIWLRVGRKPPPH